MRDCIGIRAPNKKPQLILPIACTLLPLQSSFLLRNRSRTMSAMGPEICTLGCPNLTIFSFGFSLSPFPPFLHRIRRLEARRRGQKHLPVERDLGGQAGDLLVVFGGDIGEHGEGALLSG
jgi:hypothetical protein